MCWRICCKSQSCHSILKEVDPHELDGGKDRLFLGISCHRDESKHHRGDANSYLKLDTINGAGEGDKSVLERTCRNCLTASLPALPHMIYFTIEAKLSSIKTIEEAFFPLQYPKYPLKSLYQQPSK